MKFHPYADIFPLIEGSDLTDLAFDIEQHGLREKIWTYEGKILDGRNRFLACGIAKVEPKYREYKGHDPLAFVVSLNVQRRHLTEAQRAMAAARIATMQQGARNDLASRDAKLLFNLASRDAKSQSDAAAELDVSRSSVQRAKKIIDEGSKALQKAVESGEVGLKKAAAVVDLPKSEQLAAAKAKPEKAQPETAKIEVTPAPDFDFSDYEPEDDEEYRRNIDNVMMADDKLAAMREELKQLRRELQGLKVSRDHYLSEAGAAVRLVKARDREIERLKKELAKRKAA